MKRLDDYIGIVDDSLIQEIRSRAEHLQDARIVQVNSTYMGGGVAEILSSLIPLLNDIGLRCGWRILHGTPDFFAITKKFHNGLQGEAVELSEQEKEIFLQTNQNYATYTHLTHDAVIIHDPQPMPLVMLYSQIQPWIWRCHIDLSSPNEMIWNFLKPFTEHYNKVVVSKEDYIPPDLKTPTTIIHPVIDPLALKNREMTPEETDAILTSFNVPLDKPFITQISRFDKWKDPDGVLDIFREVKKDVDCRLVLCGNMATDDPEGLQIYERVKTRVEREFPPDDITLITIANHELVNALQRRSNVIIQKSLREGFGLTVTEALWKGTPVIASRVGGIVLQIKNGYTGYLIEPTDVSEFAEHAKELLADPVKAREMGAAGKEFVRQHFLLPQLVLDEIKMLNKLLPDKKFGPT